jgi:hypothetical protein
MAMAKYQLLRFIANWFYRRMNAGLIILHVHALAPWLHPSQVAHDEEVHFG